MGCSRVLSIELTSTAFERLVLVLLARFAAAVWSALFGFIHITISQVLGNCDWRISSGGAGRELVTERLRAIIHELPAFASSFGIFDFKRIFRCLLPDGAGYRIPVFGLSYADGNRRLLIPGPAIEDVVFGLFIIGQGYLERAPAGDLGQLVCPQMHALTGHLIDMEGFSGWIAGACWVFVHEAASLCTPAV